MIRYYIKNNFKLMGRSWVNILMFTICPVVVAAVLISAFSAIMERYEKQDPFTVGYKMEEGCIWEATEKTLKETAKSAGITFQNYDGEEPKDAIINHDLGGYVCFYEDRYTIYKSSQKISEGATLDYFITQFCDEVSTAMSSIKEGNLPSENAAEKADEVELSFEHPEFMKAVNSTEYYGIVYVLYFAWCAIVCAAALLTNEKKYRINNKYTVSGLSDTQIYLGKLIPLTLVVLIGTTAAMLLMIACFGAKWGNPAMVILLLLVMTTAASSMGMMFYCITDSMISTIIISFALVWFVGFFGGSFETYMFSSVPQYLKLASPIYHCNRSMVELAVNGKTDYYLSALIYCGAIAVVCSAIAIAASHIRRRGKA